MENGRNYTQVIYDSLWRFIYFLFLSKLLIKYSLVLVFLAVVVIYATIRDLAWMMILRSKEWQTALKLSFGVKEENATKKHRPVLDAFSFISNTSGLFNTTKIIQKNEIESIHGLKFFMQWYLPLDEWISH